MTVLKRYRLPLAVAVGVMVLVVAMIYLRKDTYPHVSLDPSSIVRDGRGNAAVVDTKKDDGKNLAGLVPNSFFVRTASTAAQVGERGDPPQNSRDKGVSVDSKLSELHEAEQSDRITLNKDKASLLHNSTTSTSNTSNRSVVLVHRDANFKHTPTAPPLVVNTSSSQTSPAPHLPNFFPSKELFVRAVHFDDRPRNSHQNVSVFLVVAIRSITDQNLIVGCQIDDHVAIDFQVDLIGETPLWRAFYNHINHEEVMVFCYDLPANNNSTGYISYKMSANSTIKMAASERKVKFPAPRLPPTSKEGMKYNLTIVTCAKIFNSPPWLEEWITYQRTLGVDHIHFDAEDTFVKYGTINKPQIQAAIKSGFMSVEIWKQYLNGKELWYHNQGLIYEDCAYRFRNTYDYIVMVDTDDFFTPRVPGQGKLHYYINKYCRGSTTGSCKFKWIEYFPDYYGLNNVTVKDGNVTRRLANYSHYTQGNPKSLHRTNVVLDAATHYAYKMVPGYHVENVLPNVAYFAHLRKNKDPPSMRGGLKLGVPHSSACLEHVLSRTLLVLSLLLCLLFYS